MRRICFRGTDQCKNHCYDMHVSVAVGATFAGTVVRFIQPVRKLAHDVSTWRKLPVSNCVINYDCEIPERAHQEGSGDDEIDFGHQHTG